MPQRTHRPPLSPLITPATTSLVIIAPSPKDLNSIGRRARAGVRNATVRIMTAASLLCVPCIVYSQCSRPGAHGLARQLGKLAHREIVAQPDTLPWQHEEFKKALEEQDRHVIVLAGFWFEHQIVATTLHALADTYDVYFVLDASPAKLRCTLRLSQDRLIQAGATPVVVSQVIHEWAIESGSEAIAGAIKDLLSLPSTRAPNERLDNAR